MQDYSSRPYWIKVVGMLQQNWAVVVDGPSYAHIVFFDDRAGVLDEVECASIDEAQQVLRRNGFGIFDEDTKARESIGRPVGPFVWRDHPNGMISSSGRYWH